MGLWIRRIRGALGLGAAWAITWALVGGFIMEAIVDPRGEIVDMWPQTLAIPGFFFGLVFAVVIAASARRRRFEELSLPRFALTGAAVGLGLGATALLLGLASSVLPTWFRAVAILTPVTVLSAASASLTLGVARLAARKDPARLAGKEGSGADRQ